MLGSSRLSSVCNSSSRAAGSRARTRRARAQVHKCGPVEIIRWRRRARPARTRRPPAWVRWPPHHARIVGWCRSKRVVCIKSFAFIGHPARSRVVCVVTTFGGEGGKAEYNMSVRRALAMVAGLSLFGSMVVIAAPPAASAATINSDDFNSGNFSNWTSNTRLTIDNTIGGPAAPSARAQVTNQSAFAYRDLGTTVSQLCMSTNVNVAAGHRSTCSGCGPLPAALSSRPSSLRTATVQLRSDFAGSTRTTTTALGTGWHNIELCGTVGTNTTWNLYRDGVLIVNAWADRHRHDAGRPDPDRRHRRQDVHRQLRPRRARPGARRRGRRPRHHAPDRAGHAHRYQPDTHLDPDQLDGVDRRLAADHVQRLSRRRPRGDRFHADDLLHRQRRAPELEPHLHRRRRRRLDQRQRPERPVSDDQRAAAARLDPADGPGHANGYEPVIHHDPAQLGGIDRPVDADHLSHLPRRQSDPCRHLDHHVVHRHRADPRLEPHLHGQRARRLQQSQRPERPVGHHQRPAS